MIRKLVLFAVLAGCIVSLAHADPAPTGPFGPPYNENESWPQCGSSGWVPYGDPDAHQYHMQYYSAVGKYHMGEDWNGQAGSCDGNSDMGAPLLAIGDGQVVFLDNVGTVQGQGKRLYVRYSFPYAQANNDIMTFDIAMLHLQGMGSGISWSGSGTGSFVTKGQTIAYLGNSGTTWAHLHWEAQTDLTIPLGTNPYQNPLTKTHALKYRAPFMIVDDRRDEITYATGTGGSYAFFTMTGNAPSSTAYMERNGERKSLQKAVDAGWMNISHIAYQDGGSWHYFYNIDDNFFQDGRQYAISANLSGVVLHILVPRNSYQDDRARLDMLHAVENDSRFVNVHSETFGKETSWSLYPEWDIHWMRFGLSDGRTTYANQITYRANPLIRAVCFYDPDLGQWTNWQSVGWNNLY